MKASLGDDCIVVEFASAYNGKASQVKRGRWVKGTKTWRYPLTMAKCKEMRQAWGDELRVERKLSEWYRQQNDQAAQQAALSAAADASELVHLPTLAPPLAAFIGPDQRADARWIANAYRGAGLLAHEPGLGKTYSTIAGLLEMNPVGPVLIVCPKISVRTVWARHFAQSGCPWPVYAASGTRAQREATIAAFFKDKAPTKVLVVVAEMLRAQGERVSTGRSKRFKATGFEYPELFGIVWTAVILDESHKLLGALTISKGNLMSEGLRYLEVAPAPLGLRLAVTGTPFGDGGRIDGMFGTLHWCWPDEFTSYWRWAEENFDVTEEQVFVRGGGGAKRTVKKVGKLRRGRSEADFFKELGPRVLRRTLEEVSPDHAGLREYEEVVCEPTPKQRKQYDTFAQNAEVAVQGGIITAIGVLAEMTRARQLANGVLRKEGEAVKYTGESGKLDAVMQRLDDMGLLGKPNPARRKVVIASQWNEFLFAMSERLAAERTQFHLMTGSTSERMRERMMDTFQAPGGPNLFLMNAQAGGVSITLDAADFMFQLDEMFPPEANEQLHRRIFRRSRVHRARVVYFRTEDSIDTLIADTVAGKLAEQLKVLDARRGLQLVREVLRTTPDGRRPYLGSTPARKCPSCGARRNMYHEANCEA